MSKFGMGGCEFIIAGLVADGVRTSKEKKDGKETGSTNFTVNVDYMGGSSYLKLAHPDLHAKLIKPGSFCKFAAPVRSFKESTYPGPATLLEVDGKPVPVLGGAS